MQQSLRAGILRYGIFCHKSFRKFNNLYEIYVEKTLVDIFSPIDRFRQPELTYVVFEMKLARVLVIYVINIVFKIAEKSNQF